MEVILEACSQNGRWGLQVVGPEGVRLPARGALRHLGRRAGVECYEFSPDEGEFWVVLGGDLEAVSGCTEVCSKDLQGGDSVTLLSCRVGAVWQDFEYKRRSSRFRLLKAEGRVVTPPVAVLLAAGLVEPVAEPEPVPEPPAPTGQMAAALKAAGLID